MTASPRQLELLATPRWGWLAAALDTWFAAPLNASDGSLRADIDAAAERAGVGLPTVLVEWFELVGRRLQAVQDTPATLATLRKVDGEVVVWTENQGAWEVTVPTGDDPRCTLVGRDHRSWREPPRLSDWLHGMLLSDTLVGAVTDEGEGTLGALRDTVRGGTEELPDATLTAVASHCTELPVAPNPFWESPPRGDATTVLRSGEASGFGLEWMTATPEAEARLWSLLGSPSWTEH